MTYMCSKFCSEVMKPCILLHICISGPTPAFIAIVILFYFCQERIT